MGDRDSHHSLRAPWSVTAFTALAASLGLQLFGSLPTLVRGLCGVLALLCLAAAVEAWGAALVTGEDGVRVRGVFSRQQLAWDQIAGFFVGPSRRPGRLTPRAQLADGASRRLGDYDLPEEAARRLVAELNAELPRRQLTIS